MRLLAIVEGHGEVEAAPELLRRIAAQAGLYTFEALRPVKANRSELVNVAKLRTRIELARLYAPDAIVVIFDADDDCPLELVETLAEAARAASSPVPCEIVVANREYEAWFLGAMESLRGVRGIVADAEYPDPPESPRDAKGRLSDRMEGSRRYSETADQPALTARFEMSAAYRRCRSFQRMISAMGKLISGAGHALPEWPPTEWINL